MPFCRECGKEVQATWKVCPHCTAPQSVENSTQSTDMSLRDSVIGGDVTINQNNPEEMATAMVSVLDRLGFSAQGQPVSLNEAQQDEIREVLEVSDSLEQQGIHLNTEIEMTLAKASQTVGDHDNTRKHFTLALASATQTNDFEMIAGANIGLSNLCIRLGVGEEALKYTRASLDAAKLTGNMYRICNAMVNQGRTELMIGEKTAGVNTLMQALQISRQNNYEVVIASIQSNLATYYRKMKEFHKASDAASESLQLYKKFGADKDDICRVTYSCSLINMDNGHFQLCEEQAWEALTLAQSIGNREIEWAVWMHLGNLYRVHYQLYDQANEYYRKYVSIHRELGKPDDQWIIDNGF